MLSMGIKAQYIMVKGQVFEVIYPLFNSLISIFKYLDILYNIIHFKFGLIEIITVVHVYFLVKFR